MSWPDRIRYGYLGLFLLSVVGAIWWGTRADR